MNNLLHIDFKLLKRIVFIGFIIIFPQVLVGLFINDIIWNLGFSIVSTVLVIGYGYYLFSGVKRDVEYISKNVESLYLGLDFKVQINIAIILLLD